MIIDFTNESNMNVKRLLSLFVLAALVTTITAVCPSRYYYSSGCKYCTSGTHFPQAFF